jgi:hypothetical protein
MNSTPVPDLRDIAPPIDVFPYPLWMVVIAGLLALVVLSGLVWLFMRWVRRQRPTPAADPRQVAISALERARADHSSLDPHRFSILVSDILRAYIVAAHGLKADRQTSPEFLESIASANFFSERQKSLLERFLGRCDMLKFGKLDADPAENDVLVQQAFDFINDEIPAIEQLVAAETR